MQCPRCNVELENGICLRCGYVEEGENIERFKGNDKYTDIRLYNYDFEDMNTNQKKYMNFLMGPLYFSFRNHLIAGTIVSILAFLVLKLELKMTNYLLSIGTLCTILAFFNTIFYIVLNRLIYMAFSNPLCIALDNLKIKGIKRRHEDYLPKLVKHHSKSMLTLLIQILIYILAAIYILKMV